ncbi:MAG: hypothetical protein QNL68_11540 [Akkermansiaceae bacterium]|jgi:nucleoside-triphosphatase THEP1
MDYERYADGEALLGWVNMEARVSLAGDPGSWLQKVGEEIAESLDEKGHEVGHFKMSLRGKGKRWRIHQVMGGEDVELIEENLGDGVGGRPELRLLVNLRAEGDAVILQEIVRGVLEGQKEAEIDYREEAAFQPGKPVPVHRIA